jgi:hypothetical protein
MPKRKSFKVTLKEEEQGLKGVLDQGVVEDQEEKQEQEVVEPEVVVEKKKRRKSKKVDVGGGEEEGEGLVGGEVAEEGEKGRSGPSVTSNDHAVVSSLACTRLEPSMKNASAMFSYLLAKSGVPGNSMSAEWVAINGVDDMNLVKSGFKSECALPSFFFFHFFLLIHTPPL